MYHYLMLEAKLMPCHVRQFFGRASEEKVFTGMSSFLREHKIFTTGSTLVCGNPGISVVCIVSLNWRQLKRPTALRNLYLP
jgi:hypothetical protein